MSYPTFVDVLRQHDIQDTSQAEYNAAWKLYLSDIEDGESVSDFETWLVDHIAYAVLDGY